MDVSDRSVVEHRTADDIEQRHTSTAADTLSDQGTKALKDIVFGSIGGVTAKFIEYPFDTVKVRLQSQPDHLPLQYKGPLDCFQKSWRQDGIGSFYRGISAPVVGAAVETSSLFFTYRLSQEVLQAMVYPQIEDLTALPFSAKLVCGATSGAITSYLLTPIELIKCKMQVPVTEASASRPGVMSIIASVYGHQGLAGFWRGQLGTLIRETGGSAAWFGSYEGVKLLLQKTDADGKPQELKMWQRLTAGAAAGMSYNFLFYPADTIKSQMQTEDVTHITGGKRTFGAVGRALWRQHGLAGLYRGCGITVGRAAPSSAVIFATYEGLTKYFG